MDAFTDNALSETRWLNLTNFLLGAFVLVCLVLIAVVTLCDVIATARHRRALEEEVSRDMENMFGHQDQAGDRTPIFRLCSCLQVVKRAIRGMFSDAAQFLQHTLHHRGHAKRH